MATRMKLSLALTAVAGLTSSAFGQSFGLDDNPFGPVFPPPGILGGFGAEQPFGAAAPPFVGPYAPFFPPGLAPSPQLAVIPGIVLGDGDILSPGPVVQMPSPNGQYISSFSQNTPVIGGPPVRLMFSVDRAALGIPPSAVAFESMANQAPGDIFLSGVALAPPIVFVGVMPPGLGFFGPLPAPLFGPASNGLLFDDSMFGLWVGAPGLILPPGVLAPPITPGSHDNIDSFENMIIAAAGAPVAATWTYFTVYPDEAALVGGGLSPADIIDVAPGAPAGVPFPPFAPAAQLGLIPGPIGDAIDGLVVFDMPPFGGPANGGPGAQPNFDYALFSLAPGSPSLFQWGLDPGDVFFTDFNGTFGLYAPAPLLGLIPAPAGPPGSNDNLDALDIACVVDLNADGVVNGADLANLLANWGPCAGFVCFADVNGDGVVNGADLANLLANWGPCG